MTRVVRQPTNLLNDSLWEVGGSVFVRELGFGAGMCRTYGAQNYNCQGPQPFRAGLRYGAPPGALALSLDSRRCVFVAIDLCVRIVARDSRLATCGL